MHPISLRTRSPALFLFDYFGVELFVRFVDEIDAFSQAEFSHGAEVDYSQSQRVHQNTPFQEDCVRCPKDHLTLNVDSNTPSHFPRNMALLEALRRHNKRKIGKKRIRAVLNNFFQENLLKEVVHPFTPKRL